MIVKLLITIILASSVGSETCALISFESFRFFTWTHTDIFSSWVLYAVHMYSWKLRWALQSPQYVVAWVCSGRVAVRHLAPPGGSSLCTVTFFKWSSSYCTSPTKVSLALSSQLTVLHTSSTRDCSANSWSWKSLALRICSYTLRDTLFSLVVSVFTMDGSSARTLLVVTKCLSPEDLIVCFETRCMQWLSSRIVCYVEQHCRVFDQRAQSH